MSWWSSHLLGRPRGNCGAVVGQPIGALVPHAPQPSSKMASYFCQTQFRFVIGAAEGTRQPGGRPPRPGENSQLADRLFNFRGPPGSTSSANIFPRRLPGDAKQAIDFG